MNLDELVLVSISEFLDVEVHRDTETLDLSSKIEIVKNRIDKKMKIDSNIGIPKNGSMSYEYEMFFRSNPNDMIKIDGWIPIETERIEKSDRISEYIEIGLLRKIQPNYS